MITVQGEVHLQGLEKSDKTEEKFLEKDSLQESDYIFQIFLQLV